MTITRDNITRLLRKLLRAATLDAEIYKELKEDTEALRDAILIVLLVGISSGLGSLTVSGFLGIITGFITAVLGWIVWSVIIFLIGTEVFGKRARFEDILKCLGFAYSPGILYFLLILPAVGSTIRYVIIPIWLLTTFVVAAREVFDCGTGKAVLIAVLGSIPYWILRLIFLLI